MYTALCLSITARLVSCLQYLLRDIIQFDESLQEAIQRITSANRTCDLILGVGDGKVG